jgi:peptidoglycan/LPS O-acetylase OafA/YrhL
MEGVAQVQQKIVFANQLRGLAALLVVVNHWFGFYWRGRALVAATTFSPAQQGPEPWVANLADTHWHNTGPLGVALFFLISGFVIPFSLPRHNAGSFLAARALRIYPVYVAAVAVDLAVLSASSRYWQLPFALDWRDILLNLALVQNLDAVKSIDLVNWSLAIEIKFYLLVALLFPLILRHRILPLIAAALVICLANHLFFARDFFAGKAFNPLIHGITADAGYLAFMFIGVAFKYHLDGAVKAPILAVSAAFFFAAFCFCLLCQTGSAHTTLLVAINYLYAFAIFAAAYAARGRFRRIAPIDGLAAISYPLYLLHTVAGYALLKLLTMGFGIAYAPALAITAMLVLPLVLALHFAVELPSIAAGHALARPGSFQREGGTLDRQPGR